MTIAISLKVHEGLVLAADSASTVVGRTPEGATFVINVYNNANKVFNLYKGAPIGASTWGAGAIGSSSIATLMKNLRQRLSGADPAFKEWKIDRKSYSMQEIASQVRRFIFEEHYRPFFAEWTDKPDLGLFVVGYSAGAQLAEEYQITIHAGDCGAPQLLRPAEAAGMTWNGQIEGISRLVLGCSPHVTNLLVNNCGIPAPQAAGIDQILRTNLNANFIQEAMPLQDAIDLARFLADVSVKFSTFAPGAPTVGGPIEIAAISRHEGFKWVNRKYYFDSELNPEISLPREDEEIKRRVTPAKKASKAVPAVKKASKAVPAAKKLS